MEREKILNDIEYNILDELYFVTSYLVLREESGYSDEQLHSVLTKMVEHGLVKVYIETDKELELESVDMKHSFKSYYYLASKKGLFEHNSR